MLLNSTGLDCSVDGIFAAVIGYNSRSWHNVLPALALLLGSSWIGRRLRNSLCYSCRSIDPWAEFTVRVTETHNSCNVTVDQDCTYVYTRNRPCYWTYVGHCALVSAIPGASSVAVLTFETILSNLCGRGDKFSSLGLALALICSMVCLLSVSTGRLRV